MTVTMQKSDLRYIFMTIQKPPVHYQKPHFSPKNGGAMHDNLSVYLI